MPEEVYEIDWTGVLADIADAFQEIVDEKPVAFVSPLHEGAAKLGLHVDTDPRHLHALLDTAADASIDEGEYPFRWLLAGLGLYPEELEAIIDYFRRAKAHLLVALSQYIDEGIFTQPLMTLEAAPITANQFNWEPVMPAEDVTALFHGWQRCAWSGMTAYEKEIYVGSLLLTRATQAGSPLLAMARLHSLHLILEIGYVLAAEAGWDVTEDRLVRTASHIWGLAHAALPHEYRRLGYQAGAA